MKNSGKNRKSGKRSIVGTDEVALDLVGIS